MQEALLAYSEAISTGCGDAALFSNRAAVYLSLERYWDAVSAPGIGVCPGDCVLCLCTGARTLAFPLPLFPPN